MLVQIFTIYDAKTEAFLQPFFSQAKGSAIRAFTDSVNDKTGESQFASHPEDYTLFHLGSFDDSTATFDLLKTPVSLGLAIEFKKAQNVPVPAA